MDSKMEAGASDEVDAASGETKYLGWGSKKELLWMGGVFDCFTSLFSVLKPEDQKTQKEDEWDVPFETITEMVYLGAGAQGVVFSGTFRGEMVAVKKLRDKSETNFKHLRRLNHENIVRFKGVCTQPPVYAVIMEFCQYGPLYDFLHSGVTFTPSQILKWAKEIAYGMAYLHTHKIIHRDLKSPNVLIADNLVVKVSDFGTSREWDDVSAIMSFTGTVAWMAPEIIKHEPSSERVDVWSYGVVLWELLTQEVPFKNMETHAIMWGVAMDTVSLPIPTTCPESLQLLMTQCWNRTPRNRPPFKIIAAHLEIAGEELNAIKPNSFGTTQASWRREVQESMEKQQTKLQSPPASDLATWQRREQFRTAREMRHLYEQQLTRANDLYLEVCAVRLQLEQKEAALAEREKMLKACRCGAAGFRKTFKAYQRQTSSSSENVKPVAVTVSQPAKGNQTRRRNSPDALSKNDQPAQVVVSLVNDDPNVVTVTVKDEDIQCVCSDEEYFSNNNVAILEQKETVVEFNGNVELKCVAGNVALPVNNDNHKAELAQV